MELRTERELKYETVGQGNIQYRERFFPPYFTKEYNSAEAYKEYRKKVKTKIELSSRESIRIGNVSVLSHFGCDNRVLHSVIDVNTLPDRHGAFSNDGRSMFLSGDVSSCIIHS